jgi:chromosome segregation ATPase
MAASWQQPSDTMSGSGTISIPREATTAEKAIATIEQEVSEIRAQQAEYRDRLDRVYGQENEISTALHALADRLFPRVGVDVSGPGR